jgi:MFS family permease
MATDLAPVAALLLTTAVLLFGQGLQGILLPVEAAHHGFSTFTIGLMGSFYFAGFISGSLRGPWLIRRVGHVRAFATLATIASVVPLFHVLCPLGPLWIVLRAVTGFCFAGLFMTVESWLNERADNATRGRIFSAYSTVNLTAMMGGQLLLFVPDPSGFARFALASILVSLAAIPVSLTRLAEPKPFEAPPIDLRTLYDVSPVGLVCAAGIGIASSIFWSLGAVYAASVGSSQSFVALFMASAVGGAAIMQIPLGRWSDRGDRRRVIAFGALAAAVAGLLLALAGRFGAPGPLLLLVSLVFGASALPIWAVVVAHANDAALPGQFVRMSSALLLVYGIGACVGPLVASLVTNAIGTPGPFVVTVLSHGAIALFAIYRMGVRNIVPRRPFVDSPRTSAGVFKLDPRSASDNGSRA